MNFQLKSTYKPTGDQPKAIKELVNGLKKDYHDQVLLGVTGSGKTFTMANVIQQIQKPTLIISHNKTLAAQLAAEFRQYFPKNAVHYFVSYYDYYQPEAYMPNTDTYIEKDADINEEIDRLRQAATHSLLTRSDVIIVASVSCIYGIGSPEVYQSQIVSIHRGQKVKMHDILRQLTKIQYLRNDYEFLRGRVRVKGDILEVFPSYEDKTVRIEFFGNEIEKIDLIDALTGEILNKVDRIEIFPAKHFVTPEDRLEQALKEIEEDLRIQERKLKSQGKIVEAQRLKQRTNFDLEMIRETGYCSGIENYSRYLDGRAPGTPPSCLIDYFPASAKATAGKPKDYLLIIDESHMTIPQIGGMYEGDLSRKKTLIEYGFRLPSCIDNRPLKFDEFLERTDQIIYTSATPAEWEKKRSQKIVEQIVRPTGLVDPEVEVRSTKGQIEDLVGEISRRAKLKQRTLVTVLTKRLAEELSEYLTELKLKVAYLHSDIETLRRIDLLRDLRLGKYDCLVGINLLREGLDLPEVSLVAILDADKEGFLRSEVSLIQTMGRASRHLDGEVIMYADMMTGSMKRAIAETNRRRRIQLEYNKKHGITPRGIQKAIYDIGEQIPKKEEEKISLAEIPADELHRVIKDLENQMDLAAKNLDFERAAVLRDQIQELRFHTRKKRF